MPQQNGMIERFIKTALLEWTCLALYRHSETRGQSPDTLAAPLQLAPAAQGGRRPTPDQRIVSSRDNLVRLQSSRSRRLPHLKICPH
jgi:hypothetical protein